jgi:hypothetical protein
MKNLEEYKMSRTIICVFLFLFATLQIYCSGSRTINPEKPELGESVQIQLKDGKELEGVLIAKEDSLLKYVDASTHSLESVLIRKISSLQYSTREYDLEGNVITEQQIKDAKGAGKTVGYSFAGVALGAAAGFGVGVLIASQSDVPIGYSMAALGVAGGITMGMIGSRNDREDAIEKIRQDRLATAHEELREQLLKEQKLLDEEKKRKEQMMKELDQKKN